MVRLGDYIEQSNIRNSANAYTVNDVVGISNTKVFIPTKANMDGVSVSSYKIVNPRSFTYVPVTSRNGAKITLAYNSSDRGLLVSSVYVVFEITDETALLPEYLYLLFNRPEFDRLARFNSWGSARETFNWDDMCRVEILLPPIEVQRSIATLFNCAEEARRIAQKATEEINRICPALIQLANHSS